MAEKEEYKIIGKVVWLEKFVFYCKVCDKRYDFAILYKEFPNQPSCKVCNAEMEIKLADLRFTILHPKRGGW